jgi:hypothetical protein
MNERDFAVLCDLKARLQEMERRYPNNRRVKEMHREGWAALCKLRGALGITREQMKILGAAPQGGGTNKEEED